MSVPYLFHRCSTGLKFLVQLNNKHHETNYFHFFFLFLRGLKKKEKPRVSVSRVKTNCIYHWEMKR